MYPQADLTLLAQRKHALMRTIRARREDCSVQLVQALQPLVWIDGMYARWKAISPVVKVAAVPLAALLKHKLFPNAGVLGGLVRWAPLAVNFFRSRR